MYGTRATAIGVSVSGVEYRRTAQLGFVDMLWQRTVVDGC
jgi:hypothetical protein